MCGGAGSYLSEYLINARVARIIQRCVEPAPLKTHTSIELNSPVVDCLCLNPHTAR